jgi:hypothetical protein
MPSGSTRWQTAFHLAPGLVRSGALRATAATARPNAAGNLRAGRQPQPPCETLRSHDRHRPAIVRRWAIRGTRAAPDRSGSWQENGLGPSIPPGSWSASPVLPSAWSRSRMPAAPRRCPGPTAVQAMASWLTRDSNRVASGCRRNAAAGRAFDPRPFCFVERSFRFPMRRQWPANQAIVSAAHHRA